MDSSLTVYTFLDILTVRILAKILYLRARVYYENVLSKRKRLGRKS